MRTSFVIGSPVSTQSRSGIAENPKKTGKKRLLPATFAPYGGSGARATGENNDGTARPTRQRRPPSKLGTMRVRIACPGTTRQSSRAEKNIKKLYRHFTAQ